MMTARIGIEIICNRRQNELKSSRSTGSHTSSLGRRWSSWILLFTAMALAGCASAPTPELDDDLEAFTRGMDAILKVGMTIKEARATLREKMPPTSMNTQVTAPVPGPSGALGIKRYMIAWPTLTPGTSFVVTIFTDREGKIVRWTTGPLMENR